MTQKLNPRCVQLDEVVDPETYIDLILEGHLPPRMTLPPIPERHLLSAELTRLASLYPPATRPALGVME